ncbi:MAG: hypothetical protein V7L21_17390 [Nostoc sp.]|nr:hypothetical protein [Nostoc sp. NMS9]MBN3943087.1 hypothetical protein [Nostoc sp. NMS9]
MPSLLLSETLREREASPTATSSLRDAARTTNTPVLAIAMTLNWCYIRG